MTRLGHELAYEAGLEAVDEQALLIDCHARIRRRHLRRRRIRYRRLDDGSGEKGMRARVRYALAGLVVVASAVMWGAAPVAAACHFFTVEVAPPVVTEGSSVEVTVERDAAVVPSSVRVRTVDGSARAAQDYVAFDRRVEFPSGTTQTVTIETRQDAADEPDETFTVELSDGQGCEVNQNFGYGPPAVITVEDDDAPPTNPTTTGSRPAQTTTPTTQPAAESPAPEETTDTTENAATTTETTTETLGTSATTTVTTSAEGRTRTSIADDDEEAVGDVTEDGDDGGLGSAGLVALLVLLGVGGAAVYLVVRLRANP